MFQHIDIFYSEFILEDSNARLFNEVENFLQHFHQCQNQYSKSDMLEWLLTCLEKFALEWFNDQSKFIFLHEFDIALTNAFLLKQNNSSSLSILTSKSTCEIFESSAKSALIVSSVLIVSSASSTSSVSQKEQKLNISSENLKAIKKTKTNVVKNVKRVKSKALKAEEAEKSTSTLQDIDIFDSTFTWEDRQFSEFAKFLQHFQQCQRLYRKSNLLMLLFICLWSSAFDIWFDKQTIMRSTSLSEWIEILRVDFANVSFAKVKTSKMFCMRCDSSFNFKNKFREHVREQHAKKSVQSSFFSVDTFKLVSETMKKSTMTDFSALSVSQKSNISTATLSKQIFESSENRAQKSSIIDLSLSIDTVKSICESKKNSTVTIFKRSCLICRIDVSSIKDHFLESSLCNEALHHRLNQLLASRAHQREQEAQKQVELIEQEALKQVEVEKAISSSVSSVCLNLSIATLKIVSESLKSASNQEITCVRVICKLCKQSFNFNKKLYEHIRKHETLKFVKNSHFSINAVNLVCEIEKTSFVIFRTITLLKRSNLSSSTLETKSKSTKRSTTCRRCNQIFNFNNKLHVHIRQHHVRKSVKSSDLRVSAFESAYKFVEKSAVTCSLISQFASSILFATSRNQIFESETFFKTIISSKRSSLTLATNKNTSKSMKKLSINCSLTFSLSSSQISVRNLHEFHIQKSHLIMNDLSRMFAEKSSSFDLQRHQSRRLSSQSFDLRQSSRSCFSTSTKSYLTIENLFEMFDEKIRKNNVFQSQKNVSSREFFSKQSRITVYFKSTINRKSSISQNSKCSKSKSLKQHTFAKFIRTALFEKSFISSYKMLDIFDSNSMINCFKNEVFQISYAREILSRQFHLSSSSFDLSRCCRMCFDQFNFNKMSSKNHTSRQSMRMMN